jgi:hypothetical protein
MSDGATITLALVAALIGGGGGGFIGAWYKTRSEAALRRDEIDLADRAHQLEVRKYEDQLEATAKEEQQDFEAGRKSLLYETRDLLEKYYELHLLISHTKTHDPDKVTANMRAVTSEGENLFRIMRALVFYGHTELSLTVSKMHFALADFSTAYDIENSVPSTQEGGGYIVQEKPGRSNEGAEFVKYFHKSNNLIRHALQPGTLADADGVQNAD